jgi:glycosyltransferase involved in cell wall biosynthesis
MLDRAASRAAQGDNSVKVATICAKGLDSFLPGIERVLGRRHEVRRFDVTEVGHIRHALAWADVVWCEWANAVALHAASIGGKPLVVRMHRYETELPEFTAIPWRNVSRLVVTSEHILARARSKGEHRETGGPVDRCKAPPVVIPSGIDLARFPLQEHGRRMRIGVVGFLHGRKQPGLALQVLAELPRDAEMWFAGTPQEPHWRGYLEHVARSLGLAERVHFDGWVKDIAAWWADKDFALSCSADEGCPYNVIEAMACGVVPVVHRYEGASDQFPLNTLWSDVHTAGQIVRFPPPGHLRGIVEDLYSLDTQADAILSVVEEAR